MNRKISESKWLHRVTSCLTRILSPRQYESVKNMREFSVTEYCQHQSRVYRLRISFCSWWKKQGLHHIITPGFGCQPNLLDLSEDLWPCVMYTFIWNLLNMPAGMVPISTVKEEEEHYESTFDDSLSRSLRRNVQGSAGLPVGVMVIGLPF